MYSNKENVNILTSLLTAYGIQSVVVCPGSRNAPLVHNFNECKLLQCVPVTDERSAGFYALGIAQATKRPVAVCVTSGSALLNVAPAVAEATYQRNGIIVISADRPACWIDQQDGQTLPQPGAFGRLVEKSVSLPEPHTPEERWHCARLVKEALTAAFSEARPSVHINVPISEPLFEFDVAQLPEERPIRNVWLERKVYDATSLIFEKKVCHPMIVIGQDCRLHKYKMPYLEYVKERMVVLYEPLFDKDAPVFDRLLQRIANEEKWQPDVVFYTGGTLVSKRLKKFLRNLPAHVPMIEFSIDGKPHDTFQHLRAIVKADAVCGLQAVADLWGRHHEEWIADDNEVQAYYKRWQITMDAERRHIAAFVPAFSQMMAVKLLEDFLNSNTYNYCIHYANSTAIRLACIYSRRHVLCNRGVNGIEGSLSAAAGYSVGFLQHTICVIGDLSFFYDQNALWNVNLDGKLHILLLNNGCGSIFKGLHGLETSAVADTFVAGQHHTSAHGICQENHIHYMAATNAGELADGIEWLCDRKGERPRLLEVFTSADTDARELKRYYEEDNQNR